MEYWPLSAICGGLGALMLDEIDEDYGIDLLLLYDWNNTYYNWIQI